MGKWVALIGLCVLAACSSLSERGRAMAVAQVESREVSPEITVSASVIPSQRTEIRFPHLIRAQQVYVAVGDRVVAGDLLCEVDTEAWRAELRVKQAKLGGAQPSNQERLLGIAEELDSELSPDERDVLEAEIAQLEQWIAESQIVAPHDGLVTKRFIASGQAMPAATPLFELIAVDPIYVSFSLAAAEAQSVRVGDRIAVRIDDLPGQGFTAEVNYVGPELHMPERSFRVWASLDNADQVLKIGMQGFAEFSTNQVRTEYVVPREAVIMRNRSPHVFVVERGVAQLRSVALRGMDGDDAIIRSGLRAEELIVTRGQDGLHDGAVVDMR